MKLFCDECGWKGNTFDLLSAPHPFLVNVDINGCPDCKEVNSFTRACDEDLCWHEASSGTPTTDGGYKFHCHHHPPKNGTI